MTVYLDNAATTPMTKEVVEVMSDILINEFGNPSSIHSYGRSAKATIELSRRSIAKLVGCEPKEIIFTSGGTEADNMAIHCAVKDLDVKHIVTSDIEHHAVGHAVESLVKSHDIKVSYVKCTDNGHVDLDDLTAILEASNTKTLVSLMHANNEIGNLLPIKEVSKLCKDNQAYFHSDTVQTMGHYPINLAELNLDFVTCSAHKFHGPKGIGFLYVSKNLQIKPMLEGGTQERGLRAGTENIAGIAGLTKALDLANNDIQSHIDHVQGLKSYMVDTLSNKVEGIEFNGDINPESSLYTVLNVVFPNFSKEEMLLFMLDLEGVACSGGSACNSGANNGSHVLRGIKANTTRSSVRFSFSRYTTKADIDFAIEKIIKIINS